MTFVYSQSNAISTLAQSGFLNICSSPYRCQRRLCLLNQLLTTLDHKAVDRANPNCSADGRQTFCTLLGSVYATAADTDLEEIPSESQVSTPILSSLKLASERSISPFSVPSVLPSIRSPSVVSELLPEEIPLSPSMLPQVLLPLPSLTPTPSHHHCLLYLLRCLVCRP